MSMKATRVWVVGLLCLLFLVKVDAAQAVDIQVVDSYFKGDISNYPTHVMKLRIINPTYFDIHSETELLLFNTSRSYPKKPIIFQNSDRTIIGFGASVARASYKIILVYISSNGEMIINQNFNLGVAKVLRRSNPRTKFDADGLYLDHIDGRNLRVGFQSDSGKGSFKFEVQLQPNGHLQMVPNSLKVDN